MNLVMKARPSAKFCLHMNDNDFHNNNFALSLALIMRFKAHRKWPIWDIMDDFRSSILVQQSVISTFIFFFVILLCRDNVVPLIQGLLNERVGCTL